MIINEAFAETRMSIKDEVRMKGLCSAGVRAWSNRSQALILRGVICTSDLFVHS